jgi:DNA-directed RNA polymerase subunit M/transcription elongation factor TFIIS
MKAIDCRLCGDSLEQRTDKNGKPYFVCDPCGTQFFVRGSQGISKLEALIQGKECRRVPKDIVKETPALKSDLEDLRELADLAKHFKEMEHRYRLTCPDCGRQFWIEPKLIKTSLFDGSLKGFRCPHKNCEATVLWEQGQ